MSANLQTKNSTASPGVRYTLRDKARAEKERRRRAREGGSVAVVAQPWKVPQEPTDRQRLFLDLKDEREVFYGGAAGGGKSSCLLMAALEYVHVPNYSALLLRKTYADLSKPGALMDRAHSWLKGTGATWNEQKKQWRFPNSNAVLDFGYLETELDKYKYQSAEYQFVGFDELTQFKESQYTYLFSRLRRLQGVEIPIRMRGASNPGGAGGQWVKSRFIPEDFTPDQARECRVFWKEGEDERGREARRAFVPSTLEDNPHLDRAEYVESLDELDDVTREQLLKGDWSISQRGDILSMWDESYHVITWDEFAEVYGTPYIPRTWLLGVYRDWGTTPDHPCVTSWFATAPQGAPLAGSVFLYRGMTTWDATVREVANEINALMREHGEVSRTRRWQMSHEASSERIAYQREHKLPFQAWKTGKTRGIAQLRNALEIVDKGRPNIFRPHLLGRPKLYHVVDADQFVNPRDDAGLARHRAEAPAYKYATLKSGEPTTQLVPHALFNDAMDTERAAAADYFPASKEKSKEEQHEDRLAPELQREAVSQIEDPALRDHATHSRHIHLQRMEQEEKSKERAAGRFALPKVRFRK